MCKSLKRQLQAHHDQLIIEATRNTQISQHSCEIKSLHQLKQGGQILQKHIGYSASINSKHKPACECLQNSMAIDSNTHTKHSIFVVGFGPA